MPTAQVAIVSSGYVQVLTSPGTFTPFSDSYYVASATQPDSNTLGHFTRASKSVKVSGLGSGIGIWVMTRADFSSKCAVTLASDATLDIASGTGGGGSTTDYELVSESYRVITAFTGASVGDIVSSTQIIGITSGTGTTASVVWRNQSTGQDLASAPSVANIESLGMKGLTDAQLRATPIPVSVSTLGSNYTLISGLSNVTPTTSQNNLLDSTGNGGWVDVRGLGALLIHVQTSSTYTAGAYICEMASDSSGGNLTYLPCMSFYTNGQTSVVAPIIASSGLNIVPIASTTQVVSASANLGFIRLRTAVNFSSSSGFAITSVKLFATANNVLPMQTVNMHYIGGGSPSLVNTPASGKAVGVFLASPIANTIERASAVLTASGNSGTITDDCGSSISGLVNVTVFTATSLDIVLRESMDNGTTWQDVYHLPRITGTGTFILPAVQLNGKRRWDYTFSGTTCTFSIITSRTSVPLSINRNFYDRTINLNSTGTTTPAYYIAGCSNITFGVNCSNVTTGAILVPELSTDGIDWYPACGGNTITSVADSVVVIPNTRGVVGTWARVRTATAGMSNTLKHVMITACN